MKILAIVSSYRKQGNTARIVQMVEAQMRDLAARYGEPLDFETLYLGHMNLQFCRGCRVCFDQGETRCPLKDDVPDIKARMKAADGVIFASPLYVDDINGIMKTLIDRLAHVCHRPEFAGKCAYYLVTTGGSPTRHAIRSLQSTITWGFHPAGQAGFKTGAYMPRDQMAVRYQQETEKVARQLFRAVFRKQFEKPSFFSLMVFKIQQRAWRKANPATVDYQYWQQHGWIDPHREFFIPHDANPVTVGLARLVGGVLGWLWA
jgi:multimeric flavodoxin WrbA